MIVRIDLALGGELGQKIRLHDHDIGALAVRDPLVDDRRRRERELDLMAGLLLEGFGDRGECRRERPVAQHLDGRGLCGAGQQHSEAGDQRALHDALLHCAGRCVSCPSWRSRSF